MKFNSNALVAAVISTSGFGCMKDKSINDDNEHNEQEDTTTFITNKDGENNIKTLDDKSTATVVLDDTDNVTLTTFTSNVTENPSTNENLIKEDNEEITPFFTSASDELVTELIDEILDDVTLTTFTSNVTENPSSKENLSKEENEESTPMFGCMKDKSINEDNDVGNIKNDGTGDPTNIPIEITNLATSTTDELALISEKKDAEDDDDEDDDLDGIYKAIFTTFTSNVTENPSTKENICKEENEESTPIFTYTSDELVTELIDDIIAYVTLTTFTSNVTENPCMKDKSINEDNDVGNIKNDGTGDPTNIPIEITNLATSTTEEYDEDEDEDDNLDGIYKAIFIANATENPSTKDFLNPTVEDLQNIDTTITDIPIENTNLTPSTNNGPTVNNILVNSSTMNSSTKVISRRNYLP